MPKLSLQMASIFNQILGENININIINNSDLKLPDPIADSNLNEEEDNLDNPYNMYQSDLGISGEIMEALGSELEPMFNHVFNIFKNESEAES
jgi:hypothetical protein